MGCGERIRRVVKLFSGFDPCKVEPGSLICLSEFFLYTCQLFTAAGIVIQEKRRSCSFLILCEQIQGLSVAGGCLRKIPQHLVYVPCLGQAYAVVVPRLRRSQFRCQDPVHFQRFPIVFLCQVRIFAVLVDVAQFGQDDGEITAGTGRGSVFLQFLPDFFRFAVV